MNIKRYTKIMFLSALCASLLMLSGCYSGAQKKKVHRITGGAIIGEDMDGFPDDVPDDIHAIPNAKPKAEPLSKYGNPVQYSQFGKNYKILHTAKGYSEKGKASWYGKKFHGRRTSSGESYNMFGMTAAHKTLPIPSYVKVTNLDNGKEVILKVNDRGPFHVDRIIDLSYTAAAKLGILGKGTGRVHVAAIHPSHHHHHDTKATTSLAKAKPSALKDKVEKDKVAPKAEMIAKAEKIESSEKVEKAEQVASASAKPRVSTSTDKAIYLQLGAFSSQKSAQTMVDRAKNLALGEEIQIHAGESKHARIYRVRIGPIADETKAASLQNSLVAQQYSAQRVFVD